MSFWSLVSRFAKDDQAAVTVDWVVLTAALVTVAIGVASVIQTSLETNASTVSSGIISSVSAAMS